MNPSKRLNVGFVSLIIFVFVLIFTSGLFYTSLSNFFLADDFWYLLKISKRSWAFALTQYFSHFDPVPVFFNKLIYSIWGLNPLPYRVLLLLVHATVCTVSFALSYKIFSVFGNSKAAAGKSILCAVIFSVMYIHTENILYINGHHEAFFTLFSLTALYFYFDFRQNNILSNKIFFYLFFILALCSKGNAIIILPLVFVAEIFFFKSGVKSFFKQFYMLLLFALLYILNRTFIYDPGKIGVEFKPALSTIIPESIKNIIFAFTSFIFSLDFIKIRDIYKQNDSGFFDVITNLLQQYPFAFAAILSSVIIYLFIYIKRNQVISFGLIFILISMIPFMWIVSYERYLYLPSFGFALLLAECIYLLYSSQKVILKYSVMFVLPVFLFYNIYNLYIKKENYNIASRISENGINEIVRVTSGLPQNSTVYLRNLPDNYNGAWIFRDGWQYFPELFLNRTDLIFHKIYGETAYTNEIENTYVFNYENGILKPEK